MCVCIFVCCGSYSHHVQDVQVASVNGIKVTSLKQLHAITNRLMSKSSTHADNADIDCEALSEQDANEVTKIETGFVKFQLADDSQIVVDASTAAEATQR